MLVQATNRRGHRCSTAKAFLRPIRHRSNLDVSMHSRVLKIVIDPSTKQATAVRFEKKGKIYQVKAKTYSAFIPSFFLKFLFIVSTFIFALENEAARVLEALSLQ